MWADAYATTLMVLGVEQGLHFAVQQGIPAYMMIRSGSEDKIEARYNPAMQAYLPAPYP
jgi:thiamine biosynthesis lipoprotein ApbE